MGQHRRIDVDVASYASISRRCRRGSAPGGMTLRIGQPAQIVAERHAARASADESRVGQCTRRRQRHPEVGQQVVGDRTQASTSTGSAGPMPRGRGRRCAPVPRHAPSVGRRPSPSMVQHLADEERVATGDAVQPRRIDRALTDEVLTACTLSGGMRQRVGVAATGRRRRAAPASGWLTPTSSSRTIPMTSDRVCDTRLSTNRRRSIVPWSAQCRSSSTRTDGAVRKSS